jgi:F420-non-reducing hydrogenase iron-sulfur subunit
VTEATQTQNQTFEPQLVGLICRWCTYAGADLAGISRLEYPANLKVLKINCSGRVEPTFVITALQEGADGVFISGCHFGECHYSEGNYNSTRRFVMLNHLLDQFGIERERVRFEYISASEGIKFANVVTEFTEQIRKLGPLNWQGVVEDEYDHPK